MSNPAPPSLSRLAIRSLSTTGTRAAGPLWKRLVGLGAGDRSPDRRGARHSQPPAAQPWSSPRSPRVPVVLVAVLNATGRVVAQRRASVSIKGTGRLEWLGVSEGQMVQEGDIIARLENRDVVAAGQAAAQVQRGANSRRARRNLMMRGRRCGRAGPREAELISGPGSEPPSALQQSAAQIDT